MTLILRIFTDLIKNQRHPRSVSDFIYGYPASFSENKPNLAY